MAQALQAVCQLLPQTQLQSQPASNLGTANSSLSKLNLRIQTIDQAVEYVHKLKHIPSAATVVQTVSQLILQGNASAGIDHLDQFIAKVTQ